MKYEDLVDIFTPAKNQEGLFVPDYDAIWKAGCREGEAYVEMPSDFVPSELDLKKLISARKYSNIDRYPYCLYTEEWQELKKAYWRVCEEKERYKCSICKTNNAQAFHHWIYLFLGTPYEILTISPVCQDCHAGIHKR